MIEPEPSHAFEDLRRRIEVAQYLSRGGLLSEVIHRLLIGLASRLLQVRIRDLIEDFALCCDIGNQFSHRLLRDGHSVNLRLCGRRQRILRHGMELRIQPTLSACRL